ncbi:uncharacterized protein LOC126199017 isoform X1 [Schistocerca nitens]|uniref:uncharacterized protein LOC126199017 isoform X1 n=2 Tax=Schistocerca nitens TaxID=7011 RepID=UPI00211844BE|nr:uncharacterized protein LOC126199017 isoform X1 [Schistocerca nitens]
MEANKRNFCVVSCLCSEFADCEAAETMVGNPHRYRAALHPLENRHATAGCMLAVLLMFPLAARSYGLPVVTVISLLYVGIVVPVAAGFMSLSTIIHALRQVWEQVHEWALRGPAWWLRLAWLLSVSMHRLIVNRISTRLHITLNQILFFITMEKAMCPNQRCVSLYLLLFYSVLLYLHQSLKARHWVQLSSDTTTADLLRLTTAFIMARLAKGVALSLVLVTFTMHVGDLEPSFSFVLVTAMYFLLTEFPARLAVNHWLIEAMVNLDLTVLEGLEEYWLPVLFSGGAVILSALASILAGPKYRLLRVILVYHNVWAASDYALEECVMPLIQQYRMLQQFPLASHKQLADTPTCAVCLDDMRILATRVTPCGHLFHARCLRRCLLLSRLCPLCKQVM